MNWRRLKASRIDSLYEDVEDDEPVLGVVLEWRGEVWDGGAMARTVVAVGFLLFRLLTEKGEKREGKRVGGARGGKEG
jgi:hypothetical protein